MDPNAWQQYRLAAQVPSNRFGLPQALLEQAASLSGITAPLTSAQTVYGLPATADSPSMPALQPNLTAENIAKLPPLSSLQGKGLYESTIPGAVDPTQSWNLANRLKNEAPEPPPAHSGQRATMQQQNPYRPRVAADMTSGITQAEQNLLNIRQQLQLLNPEVPKTATSLPHLYQQLTGEDRYLVTEPETRNLVPAHQESTHKSVQPKYAHQNSMPTETMYKSHQRYEDPKPRHESQSAKYEDVTPAHAHKQVAQVKSVYGSYGAENSPSSHNSSPQIAHSSPSVSYLSQQSSAQQAYGFNQQIASSNYGSNPEAAFSAAVSMYEAVSPATQQSLQQSYGASVQQQTSQQQYVQAAAAAADHTNNASHQQQSSQIVQAQADSTTKPKKQRATKGGRSQGGGGSRSKKKKQEQITSEDQMMSDTQLMQQIQQQQQQQQQTQQQHQMQQNQMVVSQASALPGSPMPSLEHIHTHQTVHTSNSNPVAMTSMHSNALNVNVSAATPTVSSLAMQLNPMAQVNALSLQLGDQTQQLLQQQPHMFELAQSGGIEDSLMHQVHMANELLGINHNDVIKQEDQQALFLQSLAPPPQSFSAQLEDLDNKQQDSVGTVEDNLGLGLSTLDYRKQKQKTKAEQKEMPQTAAQPQTSQIVDDEFGHLKPATPATPQVKVEPKTAPAQKKQSSFQNSFLSFIQGNKQETLSSVTNSAILKKPELPKYIPEPPRPKPKPKPESPKKAPEAPQMWKSSVQAKKPQTINTNGQKSKVNSGVVFSDDDDSSTTVGSSVSNIISSLDRDDKPSKPNTSPAPLKLKIKMSDISMPPVEIKTPKVKRRSSSGKRRKSSGKRRGEDDEYEVVALDLGDGSSVDLKGGEQAPATPSPLPVRQRSSRKAKEKVEEKRKKRQEKKKKKSKRDGGEEEDFYLSSDGGLMDDSDGDKEYDSDADPGWKPEPDDFRGGTGVSMKDVGMEPKRSSGYKPKFGRMRPPKTKRRFSSDEDEEYALSEEEPTPKKKQRAPLLSQTRPVVVDCDSDDNSPHHYSKGDFVMEKKELCNPDKFIIWKIDAGKLIQKYEPFTSEDGSLMHKPLSTYSSWSDILKPNYMGIEVDVLRTKGGSEAVRVRSKFRPVPSDESVEKHEWMESFNVFVQILLSEALEPGFLSLIRNPGQYEYYTLPLKEIETRLETKSKQINEQVQWQAEFKECLDKYPLLRIASRRTSEQTPCQASSLSKEELGTKEAKLYGDVYNMQTLNKQHTLPIENAKVFAVGETANEHLRRYHRLHHFKHRMYKKCLYMVECCRRAGHRETSDILDTCLQNRIWVQMLFSEFLRLAEDPMSSADPPQAANSIDSQEDSSGKSMTENPITTGNSTTGAQSGLEANDSNL